MSPAAAAPTFAPVRLIDVCAGWHVRSCGVVAMGAVGHVRAGFGCDGLPVRGEIRIVPVNLEPRQRFGKNMPVRQRFLRTRRRLHVPEPSLETENQAQTLDVPSGERQVSEAWSGADRSDRGRTGLTEV